MKIIKIDVYVYQEEAHYTGLMYFLSHNVSGYFLNLFTKNVNNKNQK